MSAIWGAISLEKDHDKRNKRLEEIRKNMKLPYVECIIDRFEEKTFDQGFFACGLQYFKGNSDKEILPISDDDGVVFTGDVVLNERDILISEIKENSETSFEDLENAPDGTLAYLAWKIWAEDFVNHIQGIFAIAVYDTNTKRLNVFSDHVGARCIHYCISGSEIYFSTLIKPILKVLIQEEYGISEKFIAACESTTMPIMYLYPELTAFDNVYMVPRANYLNADGSSNKSWNTSFREYWNPSAKEWQKGRKKYENYSDTEFRKLFRDTFFESVKDAIDTNGEVAATISSGLDSSAVATVAAKLLTDDKQLFGYTAVPIKEYQSDNNSYYVADETEGVKRIISGYKNIVHIREDCNGISAFTEMDNYVHRYEIPGKAFVNHIWMDEIAKKAHDIGCKVLLNGQFGNFTISNGSITERVFQELYRGKIREAKHQLAVFGMIYGVPRKVLLKMMLDEISAKASIFLFGTKEIDQLIDDKYIKKDLLKKYGISNRLAEMFRYNGYSAANRIERMTRHMFNFNIMQTQGLYDTKLSLYRGILLRDPTRDKRVIELCSLLPPGQFTNNGLERRLVREYLNDCLPDEERLDVRHRGRQGADYVIRLNLYGEDKRRTVLNKDLKHYLNIDEVKKLLLEELNESNAFDTVRILALNSFLNEYEKKEP